jgi:hypothetical protein
MRSRCKWTISAQKILALFFLLSATGEIAWADTLVDATNVVGAPGVAAPSQHTFTATAAEALTVTLTDFQSPAAFGALQIAVSLGDSLVGSASVDATHTATIAIPAAAGNYTVYVVGTPDATQGFGSFGVCVTRDSDPTPRTCVANYSYSDSLTTPTVPSSTGATPLTTNFASTTAGTYTVTISDDAFPAALAALSAIMTNGSAQVGGIFNAGTSTQITLAGGTTYTLLAAATLNSGVPAGLYGIHITDPSGAAVFDRSFPVGTLSAATVVNNPTAQPLTLVLNDFGYPAALTTLGVTVTSGGTALGSLAAAGTLSNIAAPAGFLNVWTYALAGSQPGVYGLTVSSNSATLLSTTQVVNPGNASSAGSFAFVANIPSAGQYQLSVNDFEFPSALTSLTATIAQNGVALTQSADGSFAATTGLAIVVVNAVAPQTGNGIFDVAVQTAATPAQVLLDQTQAVGGVFTTQTINLGTSGGYDVTLADLGFPQNFLNLAVVVSQGGQILGKIYGGGTFPFSATPGKYVLSFVATPNSQSGSATVVPNYGLYSLQVASSVPTVAFTASTATVPAGGTATLTWSSQNATACTAAGASAWTGPQSTTGTLAIAVSSTETLTLTCTGPGGSATQSLNLMAAAVPSKSGGGSIDLQLIGGLLALWMVSLVRQRQRQSRPGFRSL